MSNSSISSEKLMQLMNFRMKHRAMYGEAHYVFAMHAAFPLFLSPDLLYLMWSNFKAWPDEYGQIQTTDSVAVSDLLLSDLVRKTGHDEFEMDAEIRKFLLERLESDERFGKERLRKVASFLFHYAERKHAGPEHKNTRETHQWTALTILSPDEAAAWMAQELSQSMNKGESSEQHRLFLMMEAVGATHPAMENLHQLSKGIRERLYGNTDWNPIIQQDLTEGNEEGAMTLEFKLPESLKDSVRVRDSVDAKARRRLLDEIQLVRDQKLTRLSMKGLGGLTELPSELFELRQLKELQLGGMPDEFMKLKTLSSDINKLTQLEKLSLTYAGLESLPREIGELKNLREMRLFGNHLTDLPDSFTFLESLEFLDLNFNQFSRFPEQLRYSNVIGSLPTNLIELDFSENELTSFPDYVPFPTSLVRVNLAKNKLKDAADWWEKMPELEELDLSDNQLSEIRPTILAPPNLTKLTLTGNPITTPPLEVIENGVAAMKAWFESKEDLEPTENLRPVTPVFLIASAPESPRKIEKQSYSSYAKESERQVFDAEVKAIRASLAPAVRSGLLKIAVAQQPGIEGMRMAFFDQYPNQIVMVYYHKGQGDSRYNSEIISLLLRQKELESVILAPGFDGGELEGWIRAGLPSIFVAKEMRYDASERLGYLRGFLDKLALGVKYLNGKSISFPWEGYFSNTPPQQSLVIPSAIKHTIVEDIKDRLDFSDWEDTSFNDQEEILTEYDAVWNAPECIFLVRVILSFPPNESEDISFVDSLRNNSSSRIPEMKKRMEKEVYEIIATNTGHNLIPDDLYFLQPYSWLGRSYDNLDSLDLWIDEKRELAKNQPLIILTTNSADHVDELDAYEELFSAPIRNEWCSVKKVFAESAETLTSELEKYKHRKLLLHILEAPIFADEEEAEEDEGKFPSDAELWYRTLKDKVQNLENVQLMIFETPSIMRIGEQFRNAGVPAIIEVNTLRSTNSSKKFTDRIYENLALGFTVQDAYEIANSFTEVSIPPTKSTDSFSPATEVYFDYSNPDSALWRLFSLNKFNDQILSDLHSLERPDTSTFKKEFRVNKGVSIDAMMTFTHLDLIFEIKTRIIAKKSDLEKPIQQLTNYLEHFGANDPKSKPVQGVLIVLGKELPTIEAKHITLLAFDWEGKYLEKIQTIYQKSPPKKKS